jgi:endoglycosylceramidase
VDGNGNIVILHGMNYMGNEFGSWDYEWFANNNHTEENFAKMSSMGFNVVRVPIAWNYIEPNEGVYDPLYFENHVDKDIAWAKKYGIYVILDMHQWRWSPRFASQWGNGLPAWAYTSYPDTFEDMERAITDFWNDLGPNGASRSYDNPSMQERLANAWKYVAERYRNEDTIVGYELFNEPREGNLNVTVFDSETLPRFFERLIDSIRSVDGSHILFWGPRWNDPLALRVAPNRSNIACSLHIYQEAIGMPYNKDIETLRRYVRLATSFFGERQPVVITEMGYKLSESNCEEWVRDITTVLDEQMLSHSWWTYWKDDGLGYYICDSNGTEKEQFVKYLDRPYPPLLSYSLSASWYFGQTSSDISSQFILNIEGTSARSFDYYWVEIYLPERYYANNFTIASNASLKHSFNEQNRILSLHLNLSEGSFYVAIDLN